MVSINIADLLVVKQGIDELRDLNIVDSDLGLVFRCDHQVLCFALSSLTPHADTA
jgi:hypothetical protein